MRVAVVTVRAEATASATRSQRWPAEGRVPCNACLPSWSTCGRAQQGASSTWTHEKQCRQPCSQPYMGTT